MTAKITNSEKTPRKSSVPQPWWFCSHQSHRHYLGQAAAAHLTSRAKQALESALQGGQHGNEAALGPSRAEPAQ